MQQAGWGVKLEQVQLATPSFNVVLIVGSPFSVWICEQLLLQMKADITVYHGIGHLYAA